MLGSNRPEKAAQKRLPKPLAFILTPHGADKVRRRGRHLQRDLDYEFSRLRGRKRLGLLWLSLAVLAFSLFLVPAAWVWSLAKEGPRGTPAMIAEAAGSMRLTRAPLPIEQVDPNLVLGVVAALDPAFCEDGAVFRQRLALDVLLWPASPGRPPGLVQRTMARYLAGYVNILWSQPRMVEVYLNGAVWGEGQIGVEAASLARYGLSARALEPRLQALPLAVAVAEPALMRDDAAPGALLERVDALSEQVRSLTAAGAFTCLTASGPAAP